MFNSHVPRFFVAIDLPASVHIVVQVHVAYMFNL